MFNNITVVILTFNEESNIARVLDKLDWAKRIVVLDSNSTDETQNILAKFLNVDMYTRDFTNHAEQWNYAISECGVNTDWILALDADYVLSEALVEELKLLRPADGTAAYRGRFKYCVEGTPLRGSIYPPVHVLFRKSKAHYVQDGHTQRLQLNGYSEDLEHFIYHDDRKPLNRWLASQYNYMKLELSHLQSTPWLELGLADKLRKLIFVAPVIVFILSYFVRGGLADGWRGLFYAMQRSVAESILSLLLIDSCFEKNRDSKCSKAL